MIAFDHLAVHQGDVLLIVDVQRDFLPGGSLAVADGDAVLAPLNRYLEIFEQHGLPIFASRDWHPPDHCSFSNRGGTWPPHCVANSQGALFASGLSLPPRVEIVSKGTDPTREAYSAFEGTQLNEKLFSRRTHRLFVGGLATEYCVFHTVKDALQFGYRALLLQDAIRAVNLQPGDGARATDEMLRLGALAIRLEDFQPWMPEAARS